MSSFSTHVLDTMHGRPAAGIELALIGPDGAIERGRTNSDGRCPELARQGLAPGRYAIRFAFARRTQSSREAREDAENWTHRRRPSAKRIEPASEYFQQAGGFGPAPDSSRPSRELCDLREKRRRWSRTAAGS